MKLVLVNFANRVFRVSQRFNSSSGLEVGGFDAVVSYSPRDIDRGFRRRNAAVLGAPRGAGYWLWKPYVIRKALSSVSSGDVVFYCDSGAVFLDSVRPLVRGLRTSGGEVMLFESHPDSREREWTKRDAFVLLECDTPFYVESPQRVSGFSLWVKGPQAVELVDEWLHHAQDDRLVTDLPNSCGLPNYTGFVEHRHDQSILSLLSKKRGIPAHRDPSQWGNDSVKRYSNSQYGQVINLTRARTLTMADRFAQTRVWRRLSARRRGGSGTPLER